MTPSQATSYTPFFMVYGSEAVLLTDLDYGAPRVRVFDEQGAKASLEDAMDQLDKVLDVLGIDEDYAVDGLELVGTWLEHLRYNVQSLPWWRELVVVLVALDEVKHQVPGVEGPTSYSMAMVLVQCL